jgi:Amt family ammonium transporter
MSTLLPQPTNFSDPAFLSLIYTQLATGMNIMWLILTGTGIFLMTAGFTMLEVGGSRSKTVKMTLYEKLVDRSIGSVMWIIIGWGIFTGNSAFISGDSSTYFTDIPVSDYGHVFQQFGFASTACTIISGAVLGRIRMTPYFIFAAYSTGIVYPIVAHVVWNPNGFLYKMGYEDFAGGSVVHVLGGVFSFVGAWCCGPRVHRFKLKNSEQEAGEDGDSFDDIEDDDFESTSNKQQQQKTNNHKKSKQTQIMDRLCPHRKYLWVREPPGSSPELQSLGSLLLFVAFFDFNAGSSITITTPSKYDAASRAALNTLLSYGSAGSTVFLINVFQAFKRGDYHIRYDLNLMINGGLAGLVAITASCGFIDPWASLVAGVLSVFVYILCEHTMAHFLMVDDPVAAVAVHGANGILGITWLGFVHPTRGVFYTGNGEFLGIQLLGLLFVLCFTFVSAIVYFAPLKLYKNGIYLRHTKDEQLVGLDFLHFSHENAEFIHMEQDDQDSDLQSESASEMLDPSYHGGSVHGGGGGGGGNNSNNNSFRSLPAGMASTPTAAATTTTSNNHKLSIHMDSGNSTPVAITPARSPSPSFTGGAINNNNNNNNAIISDDKSSNEGGGRRHHYQNNHGNNRNADLRFVMEDRRLRKRFRHYLSITKSDENILFYDAVERFQKEQNKDKRYRRARAIYERFILDSGRQQVNLASKVKVKLEEYYKGENKDMLINRHLFDEATDELFADLKERFRMWVEATPNYWYT